MTFGINLDAFIVIKSHDVTWWRKERERETERGFCLPCQSIKWRILLFLPSFLSADLRSLPPSLANPFQFNNALIHPSHPLTDLVVPLQSLCLSHCADTYILVLNAETLTSPPLPGPVHRWQSPPWTARNYGSSQQLDAYILHWLPMQSSLINDQINSVSILSLNVCEKFYYVRNLIL